MRFRIAVAVLLFVLIVGSFFVILGGKDIPDRLARTPDQPILPASSTSPETEAGSVETVAVRPKPEPRSLTPDESFGRIFGRVLTGDGFPAPDLTVLASWAPGEDADVSVRDPVQTQTDDDGRFSLENLPLGRHFVLAQKDEVSARESCLLLAQAPVMETTLILKPRHPIAGVVVDPERQPVTEVTLYPVLHNGVAISDDKSTGLAIRTDADGRFAFDAPDPGSWEFMAVAGRFAPTLSSSIPTGTVDARIQLVRGVVVSGVVVNDRTSQPIPGLDVEIKPHMLPSPPLIAQTNGAGEFVFAAVASGDYLLNVRAAPMTLPEAPQRVQVSGAPVANLVLRLVVGGVIHGSVFVEETQEPLTGIRVHARRVGPDRLDFASNPTSGHGEFEFTGLPAGEYVLSTRRLPGFAMVGSSGDGVTVHLQPGQTVEGVTIAVRQGLTISGRVLDADGNPVIGAEVRGRGEGWQDLQRSDTSGSFVLANLTPGAEVTISAATSTATSGLQGPMLVPEGGLTDVELVLSEQRNALVAGTVVDKQSRPLAARVIAWPDGRPVVDYPPANTSDSTGRFVLPNVAPGAYIVTVKPAQGEQREVLKVRVEPEQQLRNLELVYPAEAGLAVAGRIVDDSGTELPGSVTIYRQEEGDLYFQATSTTTINGEFRFDGLETGTYGIEVKGPAGYQGGLLYDVQAGTEDLQIVLVPSIRLSGQVSDSTGVPLTDFEIAILQSGNTHTSDAIRRAEFQAVTHPEGRFQFDVANGWYEILVRAEFHGEQRFTVGGISHEEPAENLHIVLE